MNGEQPTYFVAEMFPGLNLSFKVEPLGLMFALVASGLWIPTSVYAFGYMRGHHEDNQTRFFTCFALAIGFALGVAFSENLLTLFCYYEALTFSTYPLVTHHQGMQKAHGVLDGSIWVYWSQHRFVSVDWYCECLVSHRKSSFHTRWCVSGGEYETWQISLLLALFAFGTAKAALFPFHKWLPNAMVAPTPVSALLHAVAVVKAGVFTVLKVVIYIFGLEHLSELGANDWLMVVAGFTIPVLFDSSIVQR